MNFFFFEYKEKGCLNKPPDDLPPELAAFYEGPIPDEHWAL